MSSPHINNITRRHRNLLAHVPTPVSSVDYYLMWPRQNDNTHLSTRKNELSAQKAKHVILDVFLHVGATRSICIGVYEALPIYGLFNRHRCSLGWPVDNTRTPSPATGTTAAPPVLSEQVGYAWRRHKTFTISTFCNIYGATLYINGIYSFLLA